MAQRITIVIEDADKATEQAWINSNMGADFCSFAAPYSADGNWPATHWGASIGGLTGAQVATLAGRYNSPPDNRFASINANDQGRGDAAIFATVGVIPVTID